MRGKLAAAVGVLVALAGVASVATTGGELSEAVMWGVAALVPAGIVALGALPSGYSTDDN
jgi:predicted cobalt transporter CbtA